MGEIPVVGGARGAGAPVPATDVAEIEFPALPGPQALLFLALLDQLDESQWWPEAALRAAQFRQLDRLLSHAARTVPFYRERLRRAGYAPGRRLTAELWSAIPPLTRLDIQGAGGSLDSDAVPPEHGAIGSAATSGSTGTPVTLRTTQTAGVVNQAIALRDELWHGRDVAGKCVTLRPDRSGKSDYPAGWVQADWGRPVASVFATGPGGKLHIGTPLAQQAEWLARVDPDYLISIPSNLMALARWCRANGVRLGRLRGIRTFGEVVTPELRAACREAFGVAIADIYSSVEMGNMALQCPGRDHYHVQSEAVRLEVVDERGRPCAVGEVGRILATRLHNFATPLIRYDIGDLGELGPPCPCGRGLPVLARVLGRTRQMLVLPSGELRYPGGGPRQFYKVPALIQYQIVQRSRTELEIRAVARRPLTADEVEFLRGTLRAAYGDGFSVAVTYHDEIPRAPSGKFEEFRSEIGG